LSAVSRETHRQSSRSVQLQAVCKRNADLVLILYAAPFDFLKQKPSV
jgi:hypothetical protein